MSRSPDDPRRPATQDDVAKLAGVSTATVSYVLNDGPRPVAVSTRERVLAAIASLHYRPNAAARAFRLQRTTTLGLLVPDISNPFFAELAKAVQNAAAPLGYALVFADTDNDPDRERQELQSLVDRQVGGALIIGQTATADLAPLLRSGIPLVSFDRFADDRHVPTVVIDDYLAARNGVEHLRGHGHHRIAIISGPSYLPAARARYRAWLDVVATLGIDPDRYATHADFSRGGGYKATRDLLASGSDATAIFVSTDTQSIGALRAIHEAGLQVPEDIALLSFDGTQEAEFSSPPLTVIRQPLETMAATALTLLLDHDSLAAGIHRVVPHELVIRASCGVHER